MEKNGRGAVLTLRISEAEQEELRRAAEARNQSVSEYVRSMMHGQGESMSVPTTTTGTTQITRNAAAPGQTAGTDMNVHGSSWVSASSNQVVNGQTMTSVASYKR